MLSQTPGHQPATSPHHEQPQWLQTVIVAQQTSEPYLERVTQEFIDGIRGLFPHIDLGHGDIPDLRETAEYLRTWTRDGFVLHVFDTDGFEGDQAVASYQFWDVRWDPQRRTPLCEGRFLIDDSGNIEHDIGIMMALDQVLAADTSSETGVQGAWPARRRDQLECMLGELKRLHEVRDFYEV